MVCIYDLHIALYSLILQHAAVLAVNDTISIISSQGY